MGDPISIAVVAIVASAGLLAAGSGMKGKDTPGPLIIEEIGMDVGI